MRRDTSHLSLPWLLLLVPSLSPLLGFGAKDNGRDNRRGCHDDIRGQEEVRHHDVSVLSMVTIIGRNWYIRVWNMSGGDHMIYKKCNGCVRQMLWRGIGQCPEVL